MGVAGPGSHATQGGTHLPKQSVFRHALGGCLALALVILTSAPAAHAHAQEASGPAPSPTPVPTTSDICQRIPCATIGTDSIWCWCPDQQLVLSPGRVETDGRFGYAVLVVNALPVEVDLVDASGAPVAAIPSGETGRLAVPGPGRYAYTVAEPKVVSPPVLTVVGRPG